MSEKKRHYITYAGIILISLFGLWKAQYGLGGKDLAWYISVPYRVCHGDVMFWDEWLPQQLFTFPFIPITKLYLMIVGSSEGIMYASRVLYVVVSGVLSLLLYHKIKQYKWFATVAVWAYLLYVPFNVMMLFYNNIGIMAACIGIVYICTAYNKKDYFIAGLCYAFAALSQPLLAVIFIITSLIFLIWSIIKKNKEAIKKWACFTLACVLSAMPLLAYIIRYVDWVKWINNLDVIMEEFGSEHGYSSIWGNPLEHIFGKAIYKTVFSVGGIKISTTWISFAIIMATFLVMLIFVFNHIMIRSDRIIVHLILVSMMLAVLNSILCCVNYKFNTINIVWTGWLAVGIVMYHGQRDKNIKKMFVCSIVWGVISSLSFVTSNFGGELFVVAWFPMTLFGFLIIYNNKYLGNIVVKKTLWITMASCFLCMICVRTTRVYLEKNIFEQRHTINVGSAKHLIVKRDEYKEYMQSENDFKVIGNKVENIVIISENPWIYFFVNGSLGQGSSLVVDINAFHIRMIRKYLELHPDKKPELVYVPKEELKKMNMEEVVKELKLRRYVLNETENCCYLTRIEW